MKKREEAKEKFSCGFNCSQAVLSVFGEELGLDKETALNMSAGFGGGITKGQVCGAVSGAVMALGLKYGHSIEDKTKTNEMVNKFLEEFEKKNGSIVCKELLGYDLTKKEDFDKIIEEKLFESKCPLFIENAVDLLEDIF